MLRELLRLEMTFRKQGGDPSAVDDCQRRFPELAEWIGEHWRTLQIDPTGASISTDSLTPGDPLQATVDLPGSKSNNQFKKYDGVREISRGGMGVVYRATHRELGRDVAIKEPLADYSQDPVWLARLRREATLLAGFNHSNIAAVYDYGLEGIGHGPYLVMEWIEGSTLEQRLRSGALDPDETLGVCRQVAEALEAAHDKGIIHPDLKPSNIMLASDGKV